MQILLTSAANATAPVAFPDLDLHGGRNHPVVVDCSFRNPRYFERLVALGVPVTDACLKRFDELREAAFQGAYSQSFNDTQLLAARGEQEFINYDSRNKVARQGGPMPQRFDQFVGGKIYYDRAKDKIYPDTPGR